VHVAASLHLHFPLLSLRPENMGKSLTSDAAWDQRWAKQVPPFLKLMAEAVLLEKRGIDIDPSRLEHINDTLACLLPINVEEAHYGMFFDLSAVMGDREFYADGRYENVMGRISTSLLKDILVMRMLLGDYYFLNYGRQGKIANEFLKVSLASQRLSADPRLRKLHAQFLMVESEARSGNGIGELWSPYGRDINSFREINSFCCARGHVEAPH